MNEVQYRQYICDKVKQCNAEGSAWLDATTRDGRDLRIKITAISKPSSKENGGGNVVYKHKGRVYFGWINDNMVMHHGELFEGWDIHAQIKGTFPKCRYIRPGSVLAHISEVHFKPSDIGFSSSLLTHQRD